MASKKDFWDRMLHANKVKRILEKLGIDSDSFQKNYEEDTSRPRREPIVPSQGEIDAVEDFLQTNDYASFLQKLGAKSRVKADSTLRRVIAWQGMEAADSLSDI